jgi:replicative DNA helicase
MYSLELEQQLIAALLQHRQKYFEICDHINGESFYYETNKTIFSFIKNIYDKGESVDAVILSEKIKLSGISFEDNINIFDYLSSLSLRKVTEDSVISIAQELQKLFVKREIQAIGSNMSKAMEKLPANASFYEILNSADDIYHKKLLQFENSDSNACDIFQEMPSLIEDRGENIITEFGPTGPHPRLQELYGSLLRPGNITTIVARSGVGKTNFVMDFCTKVSLHHDIPVIHFDNGEMSKEELIMRQCSALSQVPIRLLETGQWRHAGEDTVKKVRSVWDEIKNYRFYYFNVGGYSVDKMIQKLKYIYYSKVGRGNPMIFSFDYIKTTSESSNNKQEFQVVGEMVDKFKRLIQSDLVFDDEPVASMITSVQSNRTGITNNRRADSLVEDESIVSLSDRITQFSSHLFGLRQKTMDELAEEEGYGTHKLTCFKYRHLGENVHRALQPVRLATGDLKRNFINLNFENFMITEIGDLQDMVDAQVDADLMPNQEEGFLDLP